MGPQKHRSLGSRSLGSAVAITCAAIAAVAGMTGCGAGQITQTNTQSAAVNGASGQVGSLFVRDAALANRDACEQKYAENTDAPLTLWVINQGLQDDELVSASSDAATTATVDGAKAIYAGRALAIASAHHTEESAQPTSASATSTSKPPSGAVTPTASSALSPTSTTKNSAASTGSSSKASSSASSDDQAPDVSGQAEIVLRSLKHAVSPGQTVKVTLVFRDAGSLTLELPIAAPSKPLECDVHTQEGEHGGSGGH